MLCAFCIYFIKAFSSAVKVYMLYLNKGGGVAGVQVVIFYKFNGDDIIMDILSQFSF